MSPFVQLQQSVIDWLFRIEEKEATFILEMLDNFQSDGFVLNEAWKNLINSKGFRVGHDDYMSENFVKIIIEQIQKEDNSGIFIRNLLGVPLFAHPVTNLVEFLASVGNGHCSLRMPGYAQPRALIVGDVLITGETVISPPRYGGNGEVLILLSGGEHGIWIGLPGRIPVAIKEV